MEEGFDITPYLQIAPLALLLIVALSLVFRGLRNKGNGANHKAPWAGNLDD